jgi:hypothetical protein
MTSTAEFTFAAHESTVTAYALVPPPGDEAQAWFWTPTWQKSVDRSIRQIADGQSTRHDSDDDFLSALGE